MTEFQKLDAINKTPRPTQHATEPANMKILRQIAELDDLLGQANHLASTDYGAMINLLGDCKFDPGWAWEADCYSDGYRDQQHQLHALISGRDAHAPDRDEADPNVTLEIGLRNPFPFSSRDPGTVGNYLMAIGFILKTMNLPKGAKVIEYGPGWGHTTAALARMGYDVTAVDIEETFLKIIEARSVIEGSHVRVMKGLFGDMPEPGELYDAVLFFESFHHCFDHAKLVERLRQSIKPGGSIFLCGETIFGDWFDYPWGVRLDGHSLWAMRNYGWMELGFRESYLTELMSRNGFRVERFELPEAGSIGIIYQCQLT